MLFKEFMQIDPSVLGIAASLVGLGIWFVKASFNRQSAITDRYFNHLEQRDADNRKMVDAFSGSLNEINSNLSKQGDLLKTIASVQQSKCPGDDKL